MSRRLQITIEHEGSDSAHFNPMNDDGSWKLYSFNRRHYNFKEPSELGITGRDKHGQLRITNPGLRRRLNVGLAFVLSYYEHGNCIWFLPGTKNCPDMQWDGCTTAGLLVWEEPPKNMGAKTYEDRVKDAANFLEVYTAWCNGEVYWYRIKDLDTLDEISSCGGYYQVDGGLEEAIKEYLREGDRYEVEGDAGWLADHMDLSPAVRGIEDEEDSTQESNATSG